MLNGTDDYWSNFGKLEEMHDLFIRSGISNFFGKSKSVVIVFSDLVFPPAVVILCSGFCSSYIELLLLF